MRIVNEGANSELFIRTTIATRPNAALKLNANVVGRLAVERGKLNDKITKQIHNSTVAANEEKSKRKIIVLDAPPPMTTAKGTKRKAPAKSTGAASVLASTSYSASTRSLPAPEPAKQVTSPSPSPTKEGVSPIRTRLVHFLALGPQTAMNILKSIGGGTTDKQVRSKIVECLNEVCRFYFS